MKIVIRGKQKEVSKHVLTALCGIGIEEVTLNKQDFTNLSKCTPEQLQRWVEIILVRF